MTAKSPVKTPDPLKPLIQKVQILRRQVASLADDDIWRPFLANHADGQTSTRAMTKRQLEAVVRALHAAGAPKAPAKSRYAAAPQYAKARAIWIVLFKAGVIPDGSDKALDGFIKRQTKKDLGALAPADWAKVIEALKSRAARKGVELRS